MMFNPFLNEFIVIPSSYEFNIFGWTASVFTSGGRELYVEGWPWLASCLAFKEKKDGDYDLNFDGSLQGQDAVRLTR
jgi:hypothetical protein